jgi:hypothetical protein
VNRACVWLPRCCSACGEPLEEWRWPLEPETYVPCLPCGRLHVVTGDGLELAVLPTAAGDGLDLRHVFEDLLAHHWACIARATPPEWPTRQAA